MADIAMMKAQIARMRDELLASPVFTSGRPDDAAKAGVEEARLARMKDNLLLMIRDLRSSESLIRLRESSLKSVPPSQRWSAAQSLKQLGDNVKAALDEAEALKSVIIDVLVRNGLLNPMQKAHSMMDLAKELEKTVGADARAELAQTLQPATISAPPAAHPTIGGIANIMIFVYLAVNVLQTKRAAKAKAGRTQ